MLMCSELCIEQMIFYIWFLLTCTTVSVFSMENFHDVYIFLGEKINIDNSTNLV